MQCLIIAAGRGSRLKARGDSKPLVPFLGVPLIERVIRAAQKAGADEFWVVTGYRHEPLHAFLTPLAHQLQVPITPIVNEHWEQDNGLSVLAAKPYIHAPFLLLMADHVFDPNIVSHLIAHPPDAGITLAVDKRLDNPLIDMEDVTRVRTNGEDIVAIGKGLSDFNGFDTGIFLCTPDIFAALEPRKSPSQDTSLSAAVRRLTKQKQAKAIDIQHQFWSDVDDPQALVKAEKALLTQLRDKPNDGPVARYINRPLSILISQRLVSTAITPNQISMVSFLCSCLAAVFFMMGGYTLLFAGGLLAQFASVIDGCDGEVARLKYQTSDYGGWFDAVLDRYADAFLLLGLTWHLAMVEASTSLIWLLGFFAIIGSFMLSYTADKYDNLMRTQINTGIRLGRDVRVLLICLGCVFNQLFALLLFIAITMNLETLRRVIVCRPVKIN